MIGQGDSGPEFNPVAFQIHSPAELDVVVTLHSRIIQGGGGVGRGRGVGLLDGVGLTWKMVPWL